MGLSRKIINAYKYTVGSRLAASNLRKQVNGSHDPDRLVDLVFGFAFQQKLLGKNWIVEIKPLQVKSEILGLCRLVAEAYPKVIVEIGTASGGTLFLFANITRAKKIVSIDLPGGAFGGSYPNWKGQLFKNYRERGAIELLRADSHSPQTVLALQKILKGQKIDFLFIDGDHTYEGVKRDFEMYAPLVREGGMVAFHDVAEHDQESGCKVSQFWNEIKQKHKHKELIENRDQGWAGIGVLFL